MNTIKKIQVDGVDYDIKASEVEGIGRNVKISDDIELSWSDNTYQNFCIGTGGNTIVSIPAGFNGDLIVDEHKLGDDNGKLYINYPMVESLKYTKEMPDSEYNSYVSSRQTCVNHLFKAEAETFAYPAAKAYRFIDLGRTPKDEVLRNWEELKAQNVSKANYIISGQYRLPDVKEDILQLRVFEAQKDKYVLRNDEVAILNSFPLFLYEFFK